MAGLYIHIPFCRAKCFYCDFYSLPRIDEFEQRFINALQAEWQLRAEELKEPITSIYFGGGTPSALSPTSFKAITRWLPVLPSNGEFTIECNPEDVTPEMISSWKEGGVNRVSMGIQSLNNQELAAVGRRHNAQQALQAATVLTNTFSNVSFDLIIGLPGQTKNSLKQSLEQLIALRPAHLSVYILSYEKGTRLWALRKTNQVEETDDETIAQMYLMVCGVARNAGYEHYEISNFALPGRYAKHNSAYWSDSPYLGLGPAAHSFDGTTRRINPYNIKKWLNDIESGQTSYDIDEETAADRINDTIMVALRTTHGLDLERIPENFRATIEGNIKRLSPGSLINEDTRIRIPEDKWLISDAIISELFV